MKNRNKHSLMLHRMYRKFGPSGGSMRWHVEVPLTGEPEIFYPMPENPDAGFSVDEELERERRRKLEDARRDEDLFQPL